MSHGLQVPSQFEAVYLVPFSDSGSLYSAVFLEEEKAHAVISVSLYLMDLATDNSEHVCFLM